MIFMLKNSIYTKNNGIFLTGDWRYLTLLTINIRVRHNSAGGGIIDYQYGLWGTETTDDSLSQPMKFNFARFHQSVSFRITEGLYAGVGYFYDGYSKIDDQKLSLVPGDTVSQAITCTAPTTASDTTKYFSSALNINVLYDSRDNMLNAYKGIYAMASWQGVI
ncbi:MAG: hypothetical protein MZV63_50000 [Marinilabiliales bacterium]|nr:hypothetical protein [Marinilabiliales bacterium]